MLRGGPREWLHFDLSTSFAVVVTCGGLCPGLNSVFRGLVMILTRYGVKPSGGAREVTRVSFSQNLGLPIPAVVQDIHRQDGTILVSDRGNPPHMEMAKTLQKQGIKQYFVIGGDGTQTGAMDTFLCTQEIGHEVAVVGVPKTIDNIFQSYFNLGHVFRFQHCLRGSGEGNFFCVRGGDLQLSLHWSGEAHGPPWRHHRFQCRSCCSKRGCLPPSGDGKLSG